MTTLEELYSIAKEIHPYAYIAGGFYKDVKQGKEPKDIDVFLYSNVGFHVVVEILKQITKEEPVEEKVSTAVGKYQIVKPIMIADRKLYGKPNELVPTIDINIARVWIDFNGLHSTEDLVEIDFQIEQKWFEASMFHKDEQRTIDRIKRYEEYGYQCIRIVKEEHGKKKTHCSMSGGYND